jgi:hypothetical protein
MKVSSCQYKLKPIEHEKLQVATLCKDGLCNSNLAAFLEACGLSLRLVT